MVQLCMNFHTETTIHTYMTTLPGGIIIPNFQMKTLKHRKASLPLHHCFYLYSSPIDSPNSRQCDILVHKSERYSYLNYQLASHHIENKTKNESSLPDLSWGFKLRPPSKPLLLLLHHSPCSLPYSHTASKTQSQSHIWSLHLLIFSLEHSSHAFSHSPLLCSHIAANSLPFLRGPRSAPTIR